MNSVPNASAPAILVSPKVAQSSGARIIDLARGAGQAIGMSGVARVAVAVVD